MFNFFSRKPKEKDIKQAAYIVSEVLLRLKKLAIIGVELNILDDFAKSIIKRYGATPYNKGYHPKWAKEPYPAVICASINEEAAHAPPDNKILKDGDIVIFDLGVRYKSACGDAAITVAVGEIDNQKNRLLRYARRTLYEGIKQVKAGVSIREIGKAMERLANGRGYNIVKDLGSHAIGKEMHEEPLFSNYDNPELENVLLKEGQVICIEPILTPGKAIISIKPDNWTLYCVDNKPAAMFEAMVRVKKNGPEILTHHLIFDDI